MLLPTGIKQQRSDEQNKRDREICCLSRHHGGPIDGPPETTRVPQHYRIEGIKGSLNWAPMMPRDASLKRTFDRCSFAACLEVYFNGRQHLSV